MLVNLSDLSYKNNALAISYLFDCHNAEVHMLYDRIDGAYLVFSQTIANVLIDKEMAEFFQVIFKMKRIRTEIRSKLK